MPHFYNQAISHHVRAVENVLEPWRWDNDIYTSNRRDNHLLVLNEENPIAINLNEAPEAFGGQRSYLAVISRGAAVSISYESGNGIRTTTLEKDSVYEIIYDHRGISSFRLNTESYFGVGLVFNLIKFDLLPILFPLGLSNSHQFLAGRLSFQCDWAGEKTLTLWRDGIHKTLKFYNVKSGHHCLDYSIPRAIVSAWTTSGKTRIMPLDLRVEDGGIEQIVWTGATKLDVPDLSFTPDEDENE